MNSDWLAASSFEQTQELIAAITTLSIHAKLLQASHQDVAGHDELHQARHRLLQFLERFQRIIESTETSRDHIMLGSDPRFGALAARYLAQRARGSARSSLYTITVPELRRLVESDNSDDLPQLIICLQELRRLIEQHAHADVTGLFGEAS